MTEPEWMACGDWRALESHARPLLSRRELRLLACAILRREWAKLEGKAGRAAVEAAEQFADGLIADDGRSKRLRAAVRRRVELLSRRVFGVGGDSRHTELCLVSAAGLAAEEPNEDVVLMRLSTIFGAPNLKLSFGAWPVLIRDIAGNPFRPASFDAAWRTADALGLARSAYESRDFGLLPVLADALEEAGCDSADLLSHLRGGGPHARGCWALDLVLGKR